MNKSLKSNPSISTNVQTKPKLLTRNQAAEFLGVKSQTLAAWLTTKRYNLPIVKIGSRVLYKESDLIAFVESNTVR